MLQQSVRAAAGGGWVMVRRVRVAPPDAAAFQVPGAEGGGWCAASCACCAKWVANSVAASRLTVYFQPATRPRATPSAVRGALELRQ